MHNTNDKYNERVELIMKEMITEIKEFYREDKKECIGLIGMGIGLLGMIYFIPFVIAILQ